MNFGDKAQGEITDLIRKLRTTTGGFVQEEAAMALERYKDALERLQSGVWLLKLNDMCLGFHIGDFDSAQAALTKAHLNYVKRRISIIGDEGKVLSDEEAAACHAKDHHVHAEHIGTYF